MGDRNQQVDDQRSAETEGPQRPRLLPGLIAVRRGKDAIQIGIDPRHAVVVSGLPQPLCEVLTRLAGQFTTNELLDRAAGLGTTRHQLVNLLNELTAVGLIEDALPTKKPTELTEQPIAPVPARLAMDATTWAIRTNMSRARVTGIRSQAMVVVHGDGRLGLAIAELLAVSGVGWVRPIANGQVQPEDLGCGYRESDIGQLRQQAAESALKRTANEVRTNKPSPGRRPDLVVLADAIVPQVAVVSMLMQAQIPHVLVHIREGVGMVGPLVLPNRTSCLWCVELRRADRDPCWSSIAAQLEGRPQLADLATTQATAALAASQALLALDWSAGGSLSPPIWNGAVEIDLFLGAVARRSWLPHPGCRCGAAAREPT